VLSSTRGSVSSSRSKRRWREWKRKRKREGPLSVACEVAVTQYLVVNRDVLISSTEEFDPCGCGGGGGGGVGKSCTTPRSRRRHAPGRVG
jgi:hypothetical protein